MLECVVNVSEGRRADVVAALADAGRGSLLDVHRDPDHNRCVLTLAGPHVEEAARRVAAVAVPLVDLGAHTGVHPRIGAVDVVPFVALGRAPFADAVAARDRFAAWAAETLELPCFLYGPLPGGGQRTLPEVRRTAFRPLLPDAGPAQPHPTAGAAAVGARPPLVAYNLWLATADVAVAREIAAAVRGPVVRALGLAVGGAAQVSLNLLDPARVGPADAYDAVAARAPVARAELVGLVPAAVVAAVPAARRAELDLHDSRTIEARLEQAGLDGGRFR